MKQRKVMINMKEANIPASILKLFLEESGHFDKEEKNDKPAFDLYQDSIYIYGLVKEQGSEKVLKDFLGKVADEYGLEAEPTLFANTLIKAFSSKNMDWNAVSKIIHCVLHYIEDYFTDENDEEDYAADEDYICEDDEDECDCCGHCDECEHDCCCGECEDCNCCHSSKSEDESAPSKVVQIIIFTTKSGQTFECGTDEDIASIKVVSSDGKMSIFNL